MKTHVLDNSLNWADPCEIALKNVDNDFGRGWIDGYDVGYTNDLKTALPQMLPADNKRRLEVIMNLVDEIFTGFSDEQYQRTLVYRMKDVIQEYGY